MLDFTRENGFNEDSEDQERAGMSYWKLIRADNLLTYAQPSGDLDRIFKLSILSHTGPLKPPSPCPSAKSCTYSMDLAAPAYNCQKRQEFGGTNPMANNRPQLSPIGLLYSTYSSSATGENEAGSPLAWDSLPSTAPELGTFTEIPSLWVGWVAESDGHHSNIAECFLYNATSSFNITFSGEEVSIKQTAIILLSPLLPEGSSKAPWDSNYQQFSGFYAASYLFRKFLAGNLTWDTAYGYIDNTDAVQTNWFEATTGLCHGEKRRRYHHVGDNGIYRAPHLRDRLTLSSDFTATIENSFRDFFISMLSDTKLHSQITVSVPCSVTENVLVWNYAPFWLVLSYSIAVGLNIIAVIIGIYCFRENGCSMDTTFSTFIVTTRSTDLDRLANRQHFGRWPIDEEILRSKIRFGELVVPPDAEDSLPRHTAFAFPSNVQPIADPKKYL